MAARVTIAAGLKPAALLLLIVLAFAAGYYRATVHPLLSSFTPVSASEDRHAPAQVTGGFVSLRQPVQTHAASLVELDDGRIRAFWFAGSREGAPDVEIRSAVYDPVRNAWSAEESVMDRERAQQALHRYIAKLGNPVAARASDHALWLYFVTVSMGGWAGSSISAMRSTDEGKTWSVPQRLVTSPFFNISTLVRNGPVSLRGGTSVLPVYHEFISKHGELLHLDGGEVFDKQRLAPGGSGTLQPVLLVEDGMKAHALMRHAGPPPHRVVAVETNDSGESWYAPHKLDLPNPDSALSALVLPDGRWLAVLNNLEEGRDVLALMLSVDQGNSWRVVKLLEDARGEKPDAASFTAAAAQRLHSADARLGAGAAQDAVRMQACRDGRCRYEFSYPYLIQAHNGDFHLVYTWNRAFIRHVRFTPAWLSEQLAESERQAKK